MTRHRSTAAEAVSAEQEPKPLTPKLVKALRDIVHRHFGEKPRKVRRCGGGRTNAVLEFQASRGRFVFRTHEHPGKVHDYLKEQWAMDAARAVGIPTPRVLEVASLDDGRPYMIMERVDGVEGRQYADRMLSLRQMGVLAARLHSVRTRGFGPVFDWTNNRLSQQASWSDYLVDGLDVAGRLQDLEKHRMLTPGQARSLRAAVRVAARWRKRPVLHHGDLRLKNLIVDPDSGHVRALIDWENCLSSPPVFWDLSIALHELGIDEKEAFLEGYGVKPAAFANLVPFMRMLNVLNYAQAVRRAAAARDFERLAWLRLRLTGALDLYER